MTRFTKSITLTLLSLLITTTALSQTARLYTTDSGLEDTHIDRLFQDRDSYIWVVTQNGLSRFDGTDFINLHSRKGDDTSLASDVVLKMFEDSQGTIWVGTSSGLQIFDSHSMTFSPFCLTEDGYTRFVYEMEEITGPSGRKEILVSASQHGLYVIDTQTHGLLEDRRREMASLVGSEHISEMFADSKGRLWAASELGGLSVVNTRKETVLEDIWDDPGLEASVMATSFLEDPLTGNVLIGTSNHGILTYDSSKGRISASKDLYARQCKVKSLLMNDDGTVLVGTENNGFKVYSPEDGTMTEAVLPNVPFNTDRSKIHCLLRDREGNVWAGAYQKGLIVIPRPMFGFRNLDFSANGYGREDLGMFTSIAEDGLDGSLWAATDGGGIYHLTDEGCINFDSTNSGLGNDSILALRSDKRGTLWIATFLEGLYTLPRGGAIRPYEGQAAMGTEKAFCLCYDRDEDIIYVGTHGGGLGIIDAATGELKDMVCEDYFQWISTLYLDLSGNLWMGTYNGVLRYNPLTGETDRPDVGTDGLSSRIQAICEDRDGTIWTGTSDGLAAYNPGNGSFRTLGEGGDGLTDGTVTGILAGDDGKVWVATAGGLNCIDPETMECVRYYKNDGLQGNEFNINAVMKSRAGELYFGGCSGVTSFSPQDISGSRHDVPPISLQSIIANGVQTGLSDGVCIIRDESSLTLRFGIPEFANPMRLRLKYRLDGREDEWRVTPAGARSISYGSLPTGRYTLEVKAFFDGEEKEASMLTVPIRVKVPAYISWEAQILYLLALCAIVLLLWRNLVAKKAKGTPRPEDEAAGEESGGADAPESPRPVASAYDFSAMKMDSNSDKLIAKVIQSIKDNIENPDFGVEMLSGEVGISRVHLNRKLKECLGTSPSSLIKSLRLKQAAYLLVHNKVNISEVAYKVGFSTHSYFSSSFHDYFGMTPKEFVAKYSGSPEDEFLKKLFEG